MDKLVTHCINGGSQEAPPLKPIGEKDIKFLAAGEKINDIETAIRELVENSIDAQARNIEVRLTKFGIDSIEVDDNGSGIEEANFDSLAVRYHTSKIKDYKNLQESLQTFGFRGEALSCLCNIANVTIITKSKSASTGCKLTYKKDGTFSRTLAARDTGTTVILKNLFHSLPVRRRELEINGKKQYDKVVRLLYEQALARPHIKFSLCKKTGSRKDKDFTHGGTSLEGCLITIFGIKIMDALLAIRQPSSNVASVNHTSTSITEFKTQATKGHQDSEDAADGPDSEPEDCSSSQTSQAIVDDLPTNNASACALALAPETSCFQSALSDVISQSSGKFYKRRSVSSKYSKERVHYSIHGYISKIGHGRNSADSQYIFVNKKPCDIPKVARLINEIYRAFNQNQQSPFYCLFINVQVFATDFNVPRKRAVILQEESKLCDLIKECLEDLYSSSVPATQISCPSAQIPFAQQATKARMVGNKKAAPMDTNQETTQETDEPADATTSGLNQDPAFSLHIDDVADSIPDLYEVAPKRARLTVNPDTRPLRDNNTNRPMPGFQSSYDLYKDQATSCGNISIRQSPGQRASTVIESRRSDNSPEKRRALRSLSCAPPCQYQQDELTQDGTIKIYINNLQDLGAAIEGDRIDRQPQQDNREFSFAIHPNFNSPAEDQLKLNLNKTSFTEMKVFGQFNCGFILARLNKHIFIIDQHASDERANFEKQLELCPMVKQRMTNPQPLYLNLIQENAIINNMEAFKRHGFEFLVDTTKSVGYRVIQTSTSISRESGRTEHLGKEDIQELIDVAIESPALLETHTLKKVKNLSASIACRKSVMVGDKLTWQQMSQILKRMSELKNPWVCAHNRPTIRHLMDTDWEVFD